jgi:hypothetical protein
LSHPRIGARRYPTGPQYHLQQARDWCRLDVRFKALTTQGTEPPGELSDKATALIFRPVRWRPGYAALGRAAKGGVDSEMFPELLALPRSECEGIRA